MKRLFLPIVFVIAAAVLASPAAALANAFAQGVASGDVTSTSAILWTRVDGGGQAKVEVWDNPGLTGKKAFQRNMPSTSAGSDFTVKIDATGLSSNTTYYYRFKHDTGTTTDLSPVGTFKTAPSASTSADVKLTYDGDSDGIRFGGVPAFNNFETLQQARLEGGDFFAYLGDTIYADSETGAPPAVTRDDYRNKYKENRTYPNLTDLLKSTSTYAVADDHEVVNDYDGQTVDPARYAAGIGAFLEYLPLRQSGLLHDVTCAGDPMFRSFHWGSKVDVIIPDERSCRSGDVAVQCQGDLAPTLPPPFRQAFGLPPNPPPGCLAAINDPTRTVLGPVQKQAFKNALLNSTAKYKLVINEYPIQQEWALPYDRWEGFGAERTELLNYIQNNGIDNVLFLTTDQHATIMNQVFRDRFENCPTLSQTCGFTTPPDTIGYEVITGPIATGTLAQEIVATFGGGALGAQRLEQFNQALDLAGVDCRDLNRFSYGVGSVNATAGTAAVSSKDSNGAVITDKRPGPDSTGTCTKTFGP